MFSYEFGLLVAFLLWVWNVGSALVAINSRFERNLNKIGQRLSWLTLTPKPIEPDELKHGAGRKTLKFLLLQGTGLPFVLASWLYVLWVIGLIVYSKSKDFGAPQAIREFRWKIRNMELSFDQLVREQMKVLEQDPADFEKIKAQLLRELEERGLRAG